MSAKRESNQEAVAAMEAENQAQLEKHRQDLEENLPQRPKMSSEYLNLKKIEENMVKQKKFAEAHQIQQKALQLEQEEIEKHLQLRQKKIVQSEQKLMHQQTIALNSLKKKCEAHEFEEFRSFEEELRQA
jgi:hypothetical protein